MQDYMQTTIATKESSSFLAYPTLIIILAAVIRLMVIGNIDLIAEESYYWNYANHLDFSYFDHPPMVAYLIKVSTLIFGVNEFAVRIPALVCWAIAGFFIFKISQAYQKGSGIYALLLLSILPFFFTQSVIMTPDMPLIAAWAACLYYLYDTLIKGNISSWYKLGISFGLGLLSKYTIVLLIPTTFIYLLSSKKTLKTLKTTPPYIAILIALIIFSPVIYWNAKHEWASILFQSSRRFSEEFVFSLHETLGLLILFLTPLGTYSFYRLFNKNHKQTNKLFLQVFTLFPLAFFAVNSVMHETKFNWIGAGLLAIIPWLALEVTNAKKTIYKRWRDTAYILLCAYTLTFICILSGKPALIYNSFFPKFIDWQNFYMQVKNISLNATKTNAQETVVVPIDKYNIASELSFYQAKNNERGLKIYGRNIFGQDALMYKYWYNGESLSNKNILIIHNDRYMLDSSFFKSITTPLTPIEFLQSYSQNKSAKANGYYYQIVTLKK